MAFLILCHLAALDLTLIPGDSAGHLGLPQLGFVLIVGQLSSIQGVVGAGLVWRRRCLQLLLGEASRFIPVL